MKKYGIDRFRTSQNMAILPREKLKLTGVDSLSNIELLSILIGSGNAKASYFEISKRVERALATYGVTDSKKLYEALQNISGVGDKKAATITSALELGRRYFDPSLKLSRKITTSSDALELFEDIRKRKNEVLKCAFINARYELILCEIISMGSIDQVGLYPREILARSLELNAYGIILCHNHPSGDPTPSSSDSLATERLQKACDLLGVKLTDHIIIASKGWNSII